MEHLAAELRTCRRVVGLISEAFRRIAQDPPGDPYEFDRFEGLWNRTTDIDRSLKAIVRDVDAVLAPTHARSAEGEDQAQAADAEAEAHASAAEAAERASFEDIDEGTEHGAQVGEQLVAVEEGEEAQIVGFRPGTGARRSVADRA